MVLLDLGLQFPDQSIVKLYDYFDENGNKEVTLEEMVRKLEDYEKNSSGDPGKVIVPKRKAQLKGTAGQDKQIGGKGGADKRGVAGGSGGGDGELVFGAGAGLGFLAAGALGKDWLDKNRAARTTTPLVGELKIQIGKTLDVTFDPTQYSGLKLGIRVPGISKNWIQKEILPAQFLSFKFANRVQMVNVLEENIGANVMLKLSGTLKNGTEKTLGSVEIPWKICLDM